MVRCTPGRRSGSESEASIVPSLAKPSGRKSGSEPEASVVPYMARPSGRRSGSESEASVAPSLASPSGRRLGRSSGLPLGIWAGQELRVVFNVICWAELLLGSGPIRDPGFMNPTINVCLQLKKQFNCHWDCFKPS